MIGRHRELAFASNVFAQAKAKRTPAVLRVTGESGVGKTCFLAELSEALTEQGWLVVSVSCQAAQRGTPFATSNRIVVATIEKLKPRITRYTGGLEEGLVRFDRSVSRVLGHESEHPSLTPETYRAVMNRFFEGIAVDCDVAFVCDDVQWMDEDSFGVLSNLQSHGAGSTSMILAERLTSEARHQWHEATTIQLESFDEHLSRDFIKSAMPDLPEDIVAAIAIHAEGSPLALTLALEDLRQHQESPDAVSRTLRMRIAQRVSAMGPDSQRFIQICALLEDPIDYSTLSKLYPNDAELEGLLNSTRQFMAAAENQFRFKHALIADAVTETIAVAIPLRKRIIEAISSHGQLELIDHYRIAKQARLCGDHKLEFGTYMNLFFEAFGQQSWSIAVNAAEQALKIQQPPTDKWAEFYQKYARASDILGRRQSIDILVSVIPGILEPEGMPGSGNLIAYFIRECSYNDQCSEALEMYRRYAPTIKHPREESLMISSAMVAAAHQMETDTFHKLAESFDRVKGEADSTALTSYNMAKAAYYAATPETRQLNESLSMALVSRSALQLQERTLAEFARHMFEFSNKGFTIDVARLAGLRERLRFEAENSYALAFEAWCNFHLGSWDEALNLVSQADLKTNSPARTAMLLAIPAAIGSLTAKSTAFDTDIIRAAKEAADRGLYHSFLQIAPWWLAHNEDRALDRFMRQRLFSDEPPPRYLAISSVPFGILHWSTIRKDEGTLVGLSGHGGTKDRSRWSQANWQAVRALALHSLGKTDPTHMLTDAIRELREMQASFLSAYAATLGGQAERKERDLLDSLGIATPHSPSRRKGAAGSKANPLTERELEVARLVAEGDSNRRIAEKLFLSERTIESHLGNIFGKINVSSRAGLLRWVIERRGSN